MIADLGLGPLDVPEAAALVAGDGAGEVEVRGHGRQAPGAQVDAHEALHDLLALPRARRKTDDDDRFGATKGL